MPGPGMKPATDATFRMPPWCFTMPSIQRSATSWPLRANTRASAAPIPTEAPVMTVTGLKIDVAILPPLVCVLSAAAFRRFAGDAVAQCDAVARGDPEQIGGAPHQIVLEL